MDMSGMHRKKAKGKTSSELMCFRIKVQILPVAYLHVILVCKYNHAEFGVIKITMHLLLFWHCQLGLDVYGQAKINFAART